MGLFAFLFMFLMFCAVIGVVVYYIVIMTEFENLTFINKKHAKITFIPYGYTVYKIVNKIKELND